MRGDDQQQNHIFTYLSPEMRVRKDHPLRAIRAMVDEVLTQLSRRFDTMYARVGRPSIGPENCCIRLSLAEQPQSAVVLEGNGGESGIRILPRSYIQGLTEHGRRFKDVEAPGSSR